MLNAVAEGRACPGFLLCGDTPAGEADASTTTATAAAASVTTRWTGNMDLRIGQIVQADLGVLAEPAPDALTDADSAAGPDPPYHHEASNDWKDYVNFPYWEPYGLIMPDYGSNIANEPTYRRWANGTDTLAPDFRSAAYQAMLDQPATTSPPTTMTPSRPTCTPATVGTHGEAVFKISVPYYITDASFSGDFVKTNAGDVCKVYVSTNGTTWTQVWTTPPLGTTHVTNQSLRTNVFGLWTDLVHQGPDQGHRRQGRRRRVATSSSPPPSSTTRARWPTWTRASTTSPLTFDNPAELQASGNVLHVVYKWKEYDGTDWTIDRQFDDLRHRQPGHLHHHHRRHQGPADRVHPAGSRPAGPDPIAAGSDRRPGGRHRVQHHSVPLTWTATGDDGSDGQATGYDLRYSTSPITDDASFAAPRR